MSVSQCKLHGINDRPICFWQNKCARMLFSTESLIRDLSLEQLTKGALWFDACW